MRATSKKQLQNHLGLEDSPGRSPVTVLATVSVRNRPSARKTETAPDDLEASSEENSVVVETFRGDYWQQSRRPLASLAFVAPLLLIYEAGILWLGPQAMRNGADVWLRQFLDLLGFSQYFLLPVLTVSLLVGWHHVTREPWRVSPKVLYAKLTECLVL